MDHPKPVDIPAANHDSESHNSQQLIQFTDLSNDQKQASVPQISNIQEIDKHGDQSDASRLSRRQPQSSSNFNEFFHQDNGTHHEIVNSAQQAQFQPLSQFDEEDEKHMDKNHDVVDGQCNDPKQMIGRFFGSQKKRDGDEVNWEEICMDIFNFLKKPSVLISLALLSILIIMTLQYNSLQREFRELSHKLKVEQGQRGALDYKMKQIDRNFSNVKKVEQDLIKKETKLEKEIKDNEEKQKKEKEERERKEKEKEEKRQDDGPPQSANGETQTANGEWGESANGDIHEIAMKPLIVHRGPPTSFFDAISRIHDKIRDLHNSFSDKIAGNSSPSPEDDGQPHIIKIHFGNPFGQTPFNPFPGLGDPDMGGLGEPPMPHFLGLDDPFGP